MNGIEHQGVLGKFQSYPDRMRPKLEFLRRLILETAAETEGVGDVEETLKWGEPSYLSKRGSTIRIDWKEAKPGQYAMYFHCGTKLVDTFRELYRHQFEFDRNRAIVFHENDVVAVEELKHCVALSLTYHKVKNLPMLGA